MVCDKIAETHVDSQTGADFAEFDDESDLLNAVKTVIDWYKEEKTINGLREEGII
jgi:dissimilatory sulfite reductase (desulfoviridin) alpha/beta subunit